ncbi:acyl-CoA thioesterase [Patulibacter minatonensis]|uniref:acyl-CoA thioesterase n=1 Tax=Patulibacter minatonensis TaxID=298163 RepID=UPI00047DDE2D|nr:thioesterase family protein [Patulibacter minatonensis]
MTTSFTHRLRVRFVECDMHGMVFNGHYAAFMDVAFTEFWRERAGSYAAFSGTGLATAVADLRVRFRSPAFFDDELDIAVTTESMSTTSMTTTYRFTRGEDLIAEGELRHVCIDGEDHGKRPWPEDLRAALGGADTGTGPAA